MLVFFAQERRSGYVPDAWGSPLSDVRRYGTGTGIRRWHQCVG